MYVPDPYGMHARSATGCAFDKDLALQMLTVDFRDCGLTFCRNESA